MYKCESCTVKKAEHFWTVVLEKTLESPFDYKVIKTVSPKGNQPWMFIERTEADAKSRLIQKAPDAGKDWGWEEKEATGDEMVGWQQTLKDREALCTACSPQCQKSQTRLGVWATAWNSQNTEDTQIFSTSY